jgi:hypothetical protein
MPSNSEQYGSGTTPVKSDTKRMLLVKLVLATGAGGGGGGSAFSSNYGGVAPAFTPAAPAWARDTGTGNMWFYDATGGWRFSGIVTSFLIFLLALFCGSTVSAAAFKGDLSGSTNLYKDPQTLYVRTNGNDATGVVGDPTLAFSTIRGAAASAGSGSTLLLIGNIFASGTNYFTNLTFKGLGGLVTVSNQTVNMPAVILSNSWLQDLWMTNASDADGASMFGIASVGSQVTNVGPIFIRDCRFQSRGRTFYLPFSTLPPGPNTIDIRDSIFESWSQAFEVWGSYTYIEGCKFTVPHAHSSGENFALTMTMNDHSTNIVESSVIEALGSTNGGGNIGVVVYQDSWSKFDNCIFRMQGSLVPTVDCAIWFIEDGMTAIFDNCTFELAPYGQSGPIVYLCRVDTTTGVPGTSGKMEFNNCFYMPQTNGVIVDNNNVQVSITVRGGNLKAANFSHPELVSWMDTVTSTNFIGAGPAPGSYWNIGVANSLSNTLVTPSGSNSLDFYIGNLEILSLTNPLGGAALGFTIPTTVNTTNKNFGAGIYHSDANGKQTVSALVAGDLPTLLSAYPQAITNGDNRTGGVTLSNGLQVIGNILVTNGIGQITNTSAASQGITLDPTVVGSSFAGAVSANSLVATNTLSVTGAVLTLQANKSALINSNVATSPYLFTNSFGYDIAVYLGFGTNNGIALNGTFVGTMTNSVSTFFLQPNDYLWVTNNNGRPSFNIKPF